MKIGIDIDDVVVDFISAFRKEAEIVVGRRLEGECGDWSFSNWKLTDQDRDAIWRKILGTPWWFLYNCKFFSDASEGILNLLREGHELTFITARPATVGVAARPEAISQLIKGTDFDWYPQVIVAHEKGPIVAALELDVFIDDKPENLISIWNRCGESTRLVVQNRSHNQQISTLIAETMQLHRVFSFSEFVEYIKELNG